MKRFRIYTKPHRAALPKEHFVLVDDDDAYLLRGYCWSILHSNGNKYARRWLGGDDYELLHHTILGTRTPVYHLNGLGLDCRRSNLSLTRPLEAALYAGAMRRLYRAAGCAA